MSTSLAEQLQRLAVPQTALFKRDKKRPSLLFDPKEAAKIRRETFFQIGLEGLEELANKNPAFNQFQNTLYSLTSRDFERSVQDSDANNLLDKNIKRFLLLLAPYVLLNPTHKALEWLIHRYSIHEYNRDDLLMLILPFHESNIFVRILQLMHFKDQNDPWFFLKALQKPGLHLTRNALFNYAVTNSLFLGTLGSYIMQLLTVHNKPSLLAVSFNFYCVLYTGTLQYSTQITEHQLSQMLPSLIKGLTSDVPDYCAASYVIVARLVAKTPLSNKILDTLLQKITLFTNSSLHLESSLVLLVLFQSQNDYKIIPDSVLHSLALNKDWLVQQLNTLNNSGSYIYPFLERLINNAVKYVIKHDKPEMVKTFLDQILADLKLDDHFVDKFLW